MSARRVVITGLGIVSCLGNDAASVSHSLREGQSGITAAPDFAEAGLRSQIAGRPQIDLEASIDRKWRRFMGDAAAYAYLAAVQAVAQSGLDESVVRHPRSGLIMGSGGASPEHQIGAADVLRSRGVRRVGPYMVTRCMSSTVSACVATALGIRGLNFSVSSACATSAHCIGLGYQQIAWGMQDVMLVGGGEEVHWGMAMLFDAMGALSSKRNHTPTQASRPYDSDRDGFVIGGGGGALILESYEHARQRGAEIIAEIIGYGASSDGADMVAPSGDGAIDCMRMALGGQPLPDYVNTHGTSTPVGDVAEINALRTVFGAQMPAFSSTKSLGGHALGAAGVHEAIHCLLMVQQGFIAGSINVETADSAVQDLPLVQNSREAPLRTSLSNSFGFGGTNASLLFQRL